MLATGRSVTGLGSTVLATVLLIACGGGSDDAAQDTAADAGTAEETPAGESTVPDSIPMDVSITFSGGTAARGGGEGTFTASGNGSSCSHNPAAEAQKTIAEWTVIWSNENAPVPVLQMRIGKAGPDNTAREMTAMVSAGQITAGSMKVPQMFMIGTYTSGAILGRGVARVQRQGDGVRIEVDAEDAGKTKMKAVILCKKLGVV